MLNRKIEALYYFIITGAFIITLLGYDFFGIKSQVNAIFITEFASILIMFIHSFIINWNREAPAFLKKKNAPFEIIIEYLFFTFWAWLILIPRNFFLAFFNFLILSILKGIRVHKFPQEAKRELLASALQGLAMFLAILAGLVFSLSSSGSIAWGIFYYFSSGILILVFLK